MPYDLSVIHTPRLSGAALHLFTKLVESPLTGWLFHPALLRGAGFVDFRRLDLEEAPSLYPRLPVPGSMPESTDTLLSSTPGTERSGFAFETAADFIAAYRTGSTTPVNVAERVLAAIEQVQTGEPPINAFIAWNADDLMSQAKASTERWRVGAPYGPLDGVPVAIKDEFDQAGFRTRVGSRFLGNTPAAADATAVARLRAAGALLIGKAQMTEFGMIVTGLNPYHGAVRNPYDPNRMTAGSSSGPAAAVAAGLCPIALGSDGGGSIRAPAAFCGVEGDLRSC